MITGASQSRKWWSSGLQQQGHSLKCSYLEWSKGHREILNANMAMTRTNADFVLWLYMVSHLYYTYVPSFGIFCMYTYIYIYYMYIYIYYVYIYYVYTYIYIYNVYVYIYIYISCCSCPSEQFTSRHRSILGIDPLKNRIVHEILPTLIQAAPGVEWQQRCASPCLLPDVFSIFKPCFRHETWWM